MGLGGGADFKVHDLIASFSSDFATFPRRKVERRRSRDRRLIDVASDRFVRFAMPFVTNLAFLFLVAMPGAPSSILCS